MDFLNSIINGYNIPLLSAFLLGVMTSISPCPLATNITAIAYVSRELKTIKNTLLNALFYAFGRGISYTLLAVLIYFGVSTFSVANIFESWGDKILGPVLILISLIMFGAIKINIGINSDKNEKIKKWLSQKGYIGSFFIGVLFALAFCPYSGVLFFGVLMPMVLSSTEGLLLPLMFALGTSLPVMIFSLLVTFSMQKVNQVFQFIQKIEKIMRYIVAAVFMFIGLYYLYILIKFIYYLL